MSEERLWNLHATYGASLRNLFVYANRPDSYHKVVISEIEKLSAEKLRKLLSSADDSPDNSHYLMSTSPMPHDRTEPKRKVISQDVLGECCKRVLKDDAEELKKLYDMLRGEKSMAASAGMVFEHGVHQYIREGGVLNLFPLLANPSPRGGNYVFEDYHPTHSSPFKLPRMEEYFVGKETDHTHELHTYFRPLSTNFASFDSWVITRQTVDGRRFLLTFQITINKKHHNLKKEGLDRLQELAPDDALVCPVILTPMGVEPRITVPTSYLTAAFLGGKALNDAFPVSYLQVDPDELFKPSWSQNRQLKIKIPPSTTTAQP